VGVGNILQRDDGIGVRAAEVMANLPLPPDVDVYDADASGVAAAHVLERRELVVVVDAIDAGDEAGAIYRLGPDELRPHEHSGMSLHDLHFLDALEETRLLGTAPDKVVILAVQVADVSTGIGLSPAVEASLDRVLELAARELDLPTELPIHSSELASMWDS
jgi:hydrogenase maturation protease